MDKIEYLRMQNSSDIARPDEVNNRLAWIAYYKDKLKNEEYEDEI